MKKLKLIFFLSQITLFLNAGVYENLNASEKMMVDTLALVQPEQRKSLSPATSTSSLNVSRTTASSSKHFHASRRSSTGSDPNSDSSNFKMPYTFGSNTNSSQPKQSTSNTLFHKDDFQTELNFPDRSLWSNKKQDANTSNANSNKNRNSQETSLSAQHIRPLSKPSKTSDKMRLGDNEESQFRKRSIEEPKKIHLSRSPATDSAKGNYIVTADNNSVIQNFDSTYLNKNLEDILPKPNPDKTFPRVSLEEHIQNILDSLTQNNNMHTNWKNWKVNISGLKKDTLEDLLSSINITKKIGDQTLSYLIYADNTTVTNNSDNTAANFGANPFASILKKHINFNTSPKNKVLEKKLEKNLLIVLKKLFHITDKPSEPVKEQILDPNINDFSKFKPEEDKSYPEVSIEKHINNLISKKSLFDSNWKGTWKGWEAKIFENNPDSLYFVRDLYSITEDKFISSESMDEYETDKRKFKLHVIFHPSINQHEVSYYKKNNNNNNYTKINFDDLIKLNKDGSLELKDKSKSTTLLRNKKNYEYYYCPLAFEYKKIKSNTIPLSHFMDLAAAYKTFELNYEELKKEYEREKQSRTVQWK